MLNQLCAQMETDSNVVLVIHGGAGTILKKNMTHEKEQAYRQKLEEALMAGFKVVEANGTSKDAVAAAIHVLEDSPLFNAGRGSVYNNQERQEMDAAIMCGKNKSAGAIAGVQRIKNPIDAAIAVMEKSEHVLLTGKGAEEFAGKHGIIMVPRSYFKSKDRLEQLRKVKQEEKTILDHDADRSSLDSLDDRKYGTVGAVALDRNGDIAAGTSTGGMTNKRYNRVGDSPLIGSGTYADNQTCGVSCTGHGEYFIRNVVAYDVSALMMYKDLSVSEAAAEVIRKQTEIGGKGGLIALDANGNVALPFNTEGMYRGYITREGKVVISIFGQE